MMIRVLLTGMEKTFRSIYERIHSFTPMIRKGFNEESQSDVLFTPVTVKAESITANTAPIGNGGLHCTSIMKKPVIPHTISRRTTDTSIIHVPMEKWYGTSHI